MEWVGLRNGRGSREKTWQRKWSNCKWIPRRSSAKVGLSSSVTAAAPVWSPLRTSGYWGGLWIEEKSPNNLKAKHIKEVDEVSVCIYRRLYLYSQNTYIRGYFQGSWVGTVQWERKRKRLREMSFIPPLIYYLKNCKMWICHTAALGKKASVIHFV